MAVSIRKPILVGGVSLSMMLWFWNSWQQSLMEVGEFGFWGMLALGGGWWWWQKRSSKLLPEETVIAPLDRAAMTEAITQVESVLEVVAKEVGESAISPLQQQLSQLSIDSEWEQLQLTIMGGQGVGKTSLEQLLAARESSIKLNFVETALDGTQAAEILNSDLVLYVVTGDLTDSQWQTLQQLHRSRQRILIIFNQQDRYSSDERIILLHQLRHRVSSIIRAEDVLKAAAAPQMVKVRQHQADGGVQEWQEQPEPDVEGLYERLDKILSQEQQQLVWANTWRQAMAIKAQAKEILNQDRRARALPLIEKYQWIAAATAFANPVPSLDLLAGAAISTQAAIDLGAIYQQKFSLTQAQTITGILGKQMVQLGIVEISTQTIGNLLKSNAMTYAAGGAIQGVSAAYLMRLAGLSLIEYWQEQEINTTSEQINGEGLAGKLKQVFEQTRRVDLLRGFVQQALAHFSSQKSNPASKEGNLVQGAGVEPA